MTDRTNTERQARFRKMRAAGLQHVSGYLPPKQAVKVLRWMAEAERAADMNATADERKDGPFVKVGLSDL